MRTTPQLPVSVRARMPVVCPPERQGMSAALRAAGFACRALVLWWAVFGLAWFVCDAFLLTTAYKNGTLPPGWLALVAAGAVALFAVMSLSRIGLVVGLGGLAAAAFLALTQHSPTYWLYHLADAVNACLERLMAIGYGGPAALLIPVAEGAADRETALRIAAALLIFLLAAVFVPNLIGRTRVFFPAVLGAGILVPIFTYNISRSNWGFAFVIASFAAILVLAAYDRRYLRRQKDCDNEAKLFPADPNRPRVLPLPAHMAEKARQRAERKQKQAAPTADEEIERYLGNAPVKPVLTPADRAERRRAERDYRRSLRAAAQYRRRQRRTRIAAGGFAGVGMLLVAMLILLVPTAYIEGSFTTVEFIDEPMQLIRRYVTAYLMGDNPILDEMGYGGNVSNFAPHTTDAQPRVFTGEEIFEVETMYNTNLYLRGWVATDYRDGSWYTASAQGSESDTFDEYRATFGTAFSPEVMRTNFYTYVDPSVNSFTDYTKRYQNHADRGFVTMQVNLRRVGGNSNMVYPPAYFNPKVGVVQYVSSEPTEYTYVNYFDGIYTGRRFLPGAEYGAVAYATTMRDSTFIDKLSVDIAAYTLANDAIRLWYAHTDGTDLALGDSLTVMADNHPMAISVNYRETGLSGKLSSDDPLYADVQGQRTLSLANDIFNRYLNFTASERADLEYAWRVEDFYRDFAYKTYTADADSDTILRAAQDAVDVDLWKQVEAGLPSASTFPATYTARHAAVMAVMAYLAAETDSGTVDENGDPVMLPNFAYTLNPTVQPDPNYDGVENFLTVTREGYCVQFASAAALMLRELGIPARYVEGYIVTDFHRNLAATSTQRYSASVRDYHAHAWVEVYYDGIGWLNYEATPVYMSDMYEPQEGGTVSSTVRPWQDPGEEEEEEPIDPEELARLEAELAAAEARRRRIIITCVVLSVLAVVAVIVTVLSIIVRRARQADDRRSALLARARGAYDRDTALTLIDETTALLSACGAAPAVGELRDEYAARLEEGYAPLSPIPLADLFDAIAAEEFGGGMGDEALRALAVFRAALGDAAKKQLSLPGRLHYRYIKHLL